MSRCRTGISNTAAPASRRQHPILAAVLLESIEVSTKEVRVNLCSAARADLPVIDMRGVGLFAGVAYVSATWCFQPPGLKTTYDMTDSLQRRRFDVHDRTITCRSEKGPSGLRSVHDDLWSQQGDGDVLRPPLLIPHSKMSHHTMNKVELLISDNRCSASHRRRRTPPL